MERLKEKDILRLAELAHLQLTVDDIGHQLETCNQVLGYVEQLEQISDQQSCAPKEYLAEATPMNDDQIRPSMDLATALRNAPQASGPFFQVPRVIGDHQDAPSQRIGNSHE